MAVHTRKRMVYVRVYSCIKVKNGEDCKGMPNTDNKIEGTFTDLKKNPNNHSGLTTENRKRFFSGFFLALAKSHGMKKQEPC